MVRARYWAFGTTQVRNTWPATSRQFLASPAASSERDLHAKAIDLAFGCGAPAASIALSHTSSSAPVET